MTDIMRASSDPLMRTNHLTLMRWILASSVAVGHSWTLATGYDPIRIFEWTSGYLAVNGFFMLSGLLIAKSLSMRSDLRSYFKSRVLRVYPALIVVLLAFALVFSPLFSDPGGWANVFAADTWSFVARVLLMGNPGGAPGGIFAGNLEADFNGPLWTIRYEMAAYVLAAIAFALGMASTFRRTFILFAVFQLSYLAIPLLVDMTTLPASIMPFFRLSTCFLLGMVLWHLPKFRTPHSGVVVLLLALFFLFGQTYLSEVFVNLALAALLLKFGLPQTSNETVAKIPDYSYGIYIWHYPVMQTVIFLVSGLGAWQLFFLSTPIFLMLSAVSWHLVEKPILQFKQADE